MPSSRLRFLALALLVAAALFGGTGVLAVQADWPPGGLVLTDTTRTNVAEQAPYLLLGDGSGGAFVVWANYLYEDPDYLGEIHAQRVTGDGEVGSGWQHPDGLLIAKGLSSRAPRAIARDGADGAYVLWEDFGQLATTNADVYGSRFLGNGTIALGWPLNGLPIANTTALEQHPYVLPDPTGGAYVTWRVGQNPSDTRLTRLLPDAVPDPGWPGGGLDVYSQSASVSPQALLADDGGNCIAILSASSPSAKLAVRVSSDGSFTPGWPSEAIQITGGPGPTGRVTACEDRAGGFYVVWEDLRSYPGPPASAFAWTNLYALHWLADGTRDPRWPADGVPICVAPEGQSNPHLVLAENLDLWVVWSDARSYALGTGTAQDLYAQRMRPDGTRAPGWPVDGNAVVQSWDSEQGGNAVTDGANGLYLVFELLSQGSSGIQHLPSDGSVDPEYGLDGNPVPPSGRIVSLPLIVWDGHLGAYVAWGESNRPGYGRGQHVYLMHYGPPVPTATTVALQSATVAPGRASLTWLVSGAASLRATVERRTEASDWSSLGSIIADGTGRMVYDDDGVEAGVRYAYRLRYPDGDAEATTPETWLDIPLRFELALGGFRPNPATSGDLTVAFTLPAQAAGSLDVLDVTGRRVTSRDLSSLGAGRHTLRLAAERGLHPGVYWLRLSHAGRALTARGVVVE